MLQYTMGQIKHSSSKWARWSVGWNNQSEGLPKTSMAPTKSCSSIDISDSPWDQLDRALQTCGLKHINLFFESVPLWTCSSPLWTSHSSGNPSMLESPLHSRLPLPSYVQWPPRDPLQRIQHCHTLCDPSSSLNPWCRAPWLPSVLHF